MVENGNFKRQHWLLVFFFFVITLGIYVPFWYKKIKKVADALGTTYRLNGMLINVLLIVVVAEILLRFITDFFLENMPLLWLGTLFFTQILGLVFVILNIVLAFKVKDILDEHYNKTLNKNISFSGVATFFFTIVYLQYKLNKILEAP